MKEKLYYIQYFCVTKCPNKLQEEISDMLRNFDRMVVSESKLEFLRQEIITQRNTINAKYSRCRPSTIALERDWRCSDKSYSDRDWCVNNPTGQITAYCIKGFFGE